MRLPGVPEVWLIELATNQIFVYRRPTKAGYQEEQKVSQASILQPAAMPQLQVTASELFG